MYNISDNYKSACKALTRQSRTKIVIDNITYDGSKYIKSYPKFSQINDSMIGGFPIKSAEFSLWIKEGNIDLTNKEIKIYRGLVIDNSIEWIPQGVFFAQNEDVSTSDTGDYINVKCYDKAKEAGTKKYVDKNTYPISETNYIKDVISQSGYELDEEFFVESNYIMKQKPNLEDSSFVREIISRYAEQRGAIALFSRLGKVQIKRPKKVNFIYKNYEYKQLLCEKIYGPIDQVIIGNEKISNNVIYPTGEKVFPWTINDNPFLDLLKLDRNSEIYSQVHGLSLNPFNLESALDSFCLDINDIISVQKKDGTYQDLTILSIVTENRLKCKLGASVQNKKSINYNLAGSVKDELKKVEFNVDYQSKKIEALTSDVSDSKEKIAKLEITTEGITQTVDSLNNDYQQTINTKTQAIGYPIYINDAGNYNAEELIVYGNSYQDGTPTTETPKEIESIQIITNLFGSELEQGGVHINGNLFETTTRIRTKDLIVVTGKQMIFSYKGNLKFNYACYDVNKELLEIPSTWKDSGTVFTPLANTKYLKLFFSNKSDTNANVSVSDVSDIQLEYGSIAHDYVPYGTWLVTKTRGKNLLNYLNINPIGGGSIVNTLNEDGSITTTGKPNAGYSKVMPITRINNLLVNGEKYTFSTKEKNTDVSIQMRLTNKETGAKSYLGGASYQSMVFTANTDLYDYDIYIQLGQLANYPEPINVTNFYQLEKGDKATDFEKFEEHTSLTDLNIYDDEGNVIGHHELLKIGNICDELDVVTGKLIKRIGKYIVSGNENKSNSTADYQSDNCYSMFLRNSINVKSNKILCNYFEVDSSGNSANFQKIPNLVKTIGTTNALVVFNFPKPLVNNLTEAANWFKEKYNSGNPVEIYYQLQEPIEYQVRTQPLELFEDINTIFVNSDIPPYRLDLTYLTKSTLNGTYATHNELKMTEDSISSTLNKKIMDEKGKTISEVEINTKQQIKDNNEAYVSTEITRQTTDAINNLKIGGTNYISHLSDNWLDNKNWVIPNVGEDVVLQTKTGRISLIHRIEIKPDTDYYLKLYSSKDVDVLFRVCDENDKFIGSVIGLRDKVIKFATNAKYIRVVVYNNVSVDDIKNGTIKIKLEEGNKPTDWSPAPEDVATSIESTNTRIQEVSDDLNRAKTELTTTQNNLKDNYSTTTQMNSTITQEINKSETKIGLEVSQKIENIQIGGTNLGRKGCISAYYDGDTNFKLTTTNFSKDGSFEFKRIKNIQNEGVMLDRYVDYEVNKHYIIHFDLKLANNTSGSTINRYFNVYNGLGHKNSRVYVDGEVYKDSAENEVGFGKNILVPDGNYHNIRLEFDAVSSSVDKDNINTNHIILQPYKQDTNLYTAQVKKFKIEKGDKATDWSPAPDDKLDTSKFTKGEIVLKINGNESTALIQADKIDLKATDILNLIANNEINLTTKNITIKSTNFSVDKDGKVTCKNINASGGTVGGFTISANEILSKKKSGYTIHIKDCSDSVDNFLVIKNETNSTYPFVVKADGSLTATKAYITGTINASSGKIGGWSIGTHEMNSGDNLSGYRVHIRDCTNQYKDFLVVYKLNPSPGEDGVPFAVTGDGSLKSISGSIGGLTINGSNGLKTEYFSVTPSGQMNLYPHVGSGGVYLFNNGMRLNATAGMSIASSSDGNRTAPSAGGIDIMACSGTEAYLACKLGPNASGTGSSVTCKNGELAFYSSKMFTVNGAATNLGSSEKMKENIIDLNQDKKDEVYRLIKEIRMKQYDYKEGYGPKFNYGFIIEDIEETRLNELLHITQNKENTDMKLYSTEDLVRLELIVIQELMKKIEKLEEKICQ